MTKALSMTPSAIAKRAKRASLKAVPQVVVETVVEPVDEAVIPQHEVEAEDYGAKIIKVGHALLHHRDGTVTKDSVWGIAKIGRHLVKFYGRRGATPRFRIEKESGLDDALALFQLKLEGKDSKKLVHLELDAAMQVEVLGADYCKELAEDFFKAVVEQKVDRRAID